MHYQARCPCGQLELDLSRELRETEWSTPLILAGGAGAFLLELWQPWVEGC